MVSGGPSIVKILEGFNERGLITGVDLNIFAGML